MVLYQSKIFHILKINKYEILNMKVGGVKTHIYSKELFSPFCLKNLINIKQLLLNFVLKTIRDIFKFKCVPNLLTIQKICGVSVFMPT
jgi:hypothetical protein